MFILTTILDLNIFIVSYNTKIRFKFPYITLKLLVIFDYQLNLHLVVHTFKQIFTDISD